MSRKPKIEISKEIRDAIIMALQFTGKHLTMNYRAKQCDAINNDIKSKLAGINKAEQFMCDDTKDEVIMEITEEGECPQIYKGLLKAILAYYKKPDPKEMTRAHTEVNYAVDQLHTAISDSTDTELQDFLDRINKE